MNHPTTDDNGIELTALHRIADAAVENRTDACARFGVTTRWTGGTRSESRTRPHRLGRTEHARPFAITMDQPSSMLGTDSAPNPVEMMMAACNACMLIGYVVLCAEQGIRLDSLEIAIDGELDLRGALGLDPTVPAGCRELRLEVKIRGNATREQFEQIHDAVVALSPARWNLSQPVRVRARLTVD